MNESFFSWIDRANLTGDAGGLQFFGTLGVIYLSMLWIALIIWVTRDAIHRSSNIFLQIGAVLLNIFLPVLGLILYLIVRPEKTLLEKYHEDMEYRLLEGGEELCASCATPAKEGFTYCPNCGDELFQACTSCKKNFSRRWQICPYCGTEQQQEEVPEEKSE